ncbi:uncharacterized protein LOC129591468 [Paramacrobiotus metropolitanus]|uniref:uncharacterized protein LOC129591468 n=1 Tax=Paramacrobiotus metropolitanus TaxID=2943436 RepID=UPI002445749D|nr:uncharacterized protein LOC129591468 [Paramacrobiotus metropolitanus]
MDGQGTKRKLDVTEDEYSITHSTENVHGLDEHIVSRHVSIQSFSEVDDDSVTAQSYQYARQNEQRQLETGFLEALTQCLLAQMDAKDDSGMSFLTCRAFYHFQMDLEDLQSGKWNDFGQGKLQRVRVSQTSHEISPLPAWLENGVGLQVFFQSKVATNRPHTSDSESKHGFEIPWQAKIQLEQIPDECILMEVQLAFINPDGHGSPTVKVTMAPPHATYISFVNNVLKEINGQTYSECCHELGIFRQAYCFVTMRVPLLRFISKLLKKFRRTIPNCPPLTDEIALAGADNVVLKTRQGKVETDRQVLVGLSPAARALFAVGKLGKVSSFEVDCSKVALMTVVGAAVRKHESLPVDPCQTALCFLYEVMKLALSWEIPQLSLWTQVAFVERWCHPVVNLEQIPVLDAIRAICEYADPEKAGSRMIVCGLITALRILHSPIASWTLDEMQRLIAPYPALWEHFLPLARLVLDTSILVKTVTGRIITIAVNLGFSAYQVKCCIQEKEGIPVDQQRLLYAGKQLSDNVTLADYGIKAEAIVHLVVRKRGC